MQQWDQKREEKSYKAVTFSSVSKQLFFDLTGT